MSLSVTALWIACFILTVTFPPLYKTLGLAYHLLDVRRHLSAGLRVPVLRLPETKGKSLEELERELVLR